MKISLKRILIFTALSASLMFNCTACTRSNNVVENNTNISANDRTKNVEVSNKFSSQIVQVEYEILLQALQDAGITELSWDLADCDQDGNDELFISAKTSTYNPGYSLLLADSDIETLWSYAATGAAGYTNWVCIPEIEGFVWNDSYQTVGTQKSIYSTWNGQMWEQKAVLNGGSSQNESGQYTFSGTTQWFGSEISFEEFKTMEEEYVEFAELKNPELKINTIVGDKKAIYAELSAYFKTRNGFVTEVDVDTNADGTDEHLYIIKQAANKWFGNMNVENCWGDEKHIDYIDQGVTVIITDDIAEGVQLQISRINIQGTNFSSNKNWLLIDGTKYSFINGEFCRVIESDDLLKMSKEEIKTQVFEEPYRIYHWFTGASFAGRVSESEKKIVNGKPYYKILDGEYTHYSDMISYAAKYFSNDLLEEFIAKGSVLDVDGELYQFNPGYGGPFDPGYPVEYDIVTHTNDKIVYCRCSKYPKDPWTNKPLEQMTEEDYNSFYTYYVMELIDGSWFFTEWEQQRSS